MRVHPLSGDTVACSSKRALTSFLRGLQKAPTGDRPLIRLGIYFHGAKPVKGHPFSSALVGAAQRRRGVSFGNEKPATEGLERHPAPDGAHRSTAVFAVVGPLQFAHLILIELV
jgi:hypothetical protein